MSREEVSEHVAKGIAKRLLNQPSKTELPHAMKWCIPCQQLHYPPKSAQEHREMKCLALYPTEIP